MLQNDLMEAMMRAKNVLPAFCGLYGSCGAAVGLGIYASILTDSDQYSVRMGLANKIVGGCLLKISKSMDRCCKRSSYIAFRSAKNLARKNSALIWVQQDSFNVPII